MLNSIFDDVMDLFLSEDDKLLIELKKSKPVVVFDDDDKLFKKGFKDTYLYLQKDENNSCR